MRRPIALLPVVALAGAVACQEYQFTPVGRCLLQPSRVSVTNLSVIDVLFVVDDSLSMDPIQKSLADNFGAFLDRVAQKQRERVAAGKEPFDFHIAVTSSSVLVNRYTGDIVTNYYNYVGPNCTPGVLRANGDPYPAGAFLALGSNPKVLSFTKELGWANPSGDARLQALSEQFRQNIKVGSCGANQEMHLEAARLALQKALAGKQGLPAGVSWPHPGSKIVVVFVGNEDDCSTKRADEGGLVWDGQQAAADSCHADAQRSTPLQLTPYADYVKYLTGLGRPVSAAFVRPGFSDCSGAGGPGTRMHSVAAALAGAGASVVEASVCGDFSQSLAQIADQLPSDQLVLPSTPASAVVTQLRVQSRAGDTVHTCDGPDVSREWWFVDCGTTPPAALPAGRTDACVQIQAGSACEPGPGETLIAEYLGRVPASGCATSGECASVLGGQATSWDCVGASAAQKGTCVCAR